MIITNDNVAKSAVERDWLLINTPDVCHSNRRGEDLVVSISGRVKPRYVDPTTITCVCSKGRMCVYRSRDGVDWQQPVYYIFTSFDNGFFVDEKSFNLINRYFGFPVTDEDED